MNTIDDVRKSFEPWRTTRIKRGPIPESLWNDAVGLMEYYPASVIAKELRLNATQLKRKSLVLTERVDPVDDFKETDWQAITRHFPPQ